MEEKSRVRLESEMYPDFIAELMEVRQAGISPQLLNKIIDKHINNAAYNKALYERYMGLNGCVPIHNRKPRFEMETPEDKKVQPINNKINNDFFGEIIDFKVGYFAGKPASYSYSKTSESEGTTENGEEGVKEARKALTDFIARNNMQDIDMEATKHASVYGYCGRLFYHDFEGNERVVIVPGYEAIILSETSISEPEYAIRYFQTPDINGSLYWTVEFYDASTVSVYTGQLGSLNLTETKKNLYGYCPLQGIPNNSELMGDAEKVLTLIDAYDRVMSDSSNQIEGQVNSKEIYENVNITREEIALGNYTGALQFHNGAGTGKIYKLESNINDNFVEHHLAHIAENIYRFSRTPNLNDQAFGNATGVALKFKLTGLETKCGTFEAKMKTAGVYMFKLLGAAWAKKTLVIDPLQCIIEFKRNFPLDILSEAQAAQALIGAGLPKEVAYSIAISSIDDIDYVMQLIEEEQSNIPSLEDNIADDNEEDEKNDEIDREDDEAEESDDIKDEE